jgi:hypothetical protein
LGPDGAGLGCVARAGQGPAASLVGEDAEAAGFLREAEELIECKAASKEQ